MQPDAAVALGHLPGRRLRQPDAASRTCRATCCSSRSRSARRPRPPVIPDRVDAGEPRRRGLPERHLRRPGARGRAARHGEEAPAVRAALCLPGHGRTHQHRHRRPVGRASHPGHRAGRGRRLGHFPRAGQHAHRRAAAGRQRPGAATHAELVHGHAGRDALVRRLPREPERRAAAASPRWPCSASRRRSTPWYGPARGFSFAREVQPVLDKYCVGCHDGSPTADGRRKPDFRRPTARTLDWRKKRADGRAPVHTRVSGVASVRPPARAGKRLLPATAPGISCQHQRAWSRCSKRVTTT